MSGSALLAFALTAVQGGGGAAGGTRAWAQSEPAPAAGRDSLPYPFGVGEKLQYEVALGGARVGQARMEVLGIENVRGQDAFHTRFNVKGGLLFFKVNDMLESWIDTATLSSHRFVQQIHEGHYSKDRFFEIYPERAVLHQRGYEELPSVSDPLDDASFLYFIRTVPLEVGKTYEFNRYFRPDRNPVRIVVLGKERVKVPAGTFDAIKIQPFIKSQGLFAEGGEAYIWLTNDDRRLMVQFRSKVKIVGSLDLYLTSYRPPTSTTTANGR